MKPMNIERCRKYHLKKVHKDESKINSILSMHRKRIEFIKFIISDVKNKKRFSSIICENYYETIKELLIALLLKYRFKSKNHECLISFFKDKFPEYEQESVILHQLKNRRNKLHYDARQMSSDYLLTYEANFLKIIKILVQIITSHP